MSSTAGTGRFTERVAVVTGGASGAGSSICREFAAQGATVVVADLNISAATALAKELGTNHVHAIAVDITDSSSVSALAAQVTQQCGRSADILINNAGVRIVKSLLDHTDDDWEKMININLTGHFYCTRAFAPAMIERGWGRIINIASIASFVGRPDRVAYCAAKAGTLGLTRAAAIDLRHSGITVNAIAPGSIATPLNAQAKNDNNVDWGGETLVGRWGQGNDIAKAAAYLASDDASYVNGTTLTVDGGWVSAKARDGEIGSS
ncbi:SDR family oxidoreductase [Pusillimonas sp. MFBS29]|uniref:SDR family NAD(P)-dependent oxidoreductase n=1 Tax=Pusillimonas sp. MFBS29 TaxID=2886690 RepID=UPI001D11DB9F|nr:SDR family NAD(P)-dependent oxidoreductase [Pusillimonas sp. MFBS29]MCC2597514.1 SDR family oxidoreductase [Pusillimonas sp. MFBS29]